MTVHKADPAHRAEQLARFYGGLDRHPSGYLTKDAKAKWRAWLDAFGISEERARQIMTGRDQKHLERQVLNPETARKYTKYLRRHGYTVIPPDEA